MLYTHVYYEPVRWGTATSWYVGLGLNLRCHLYPLQTHCLSASLSSKINISTFSNNVSKTYMHDMSQWDDIQSYQSSLIQMDSYSEKKKIKH